MRIDPIQLHNQSSLIHDYRNNNNKIMQFFEYHPFTDFHQRVDDLKERSFDREQLATVLEKINKKWNAPKSTLQNIERLKEENSTVVIGGQQAGLMTGPLYAVNKVISIIQLAKEQEAELGLPVIPVFWIAGEDHDFDEINHVYLPNAASMKKHKLLQQVLEKNSVSDIKIDETISSQWLNSLFEELPETDITKNLYAVIKSCLDQSVTYVDFFARIIFQLFEEEGLILIDSGHPLVRKMESGHFVQLIERQSEISKGVHQAVEKLNAANYSISLDAKPEDAHLFYHYKGERILLIRNEDGQWIGKQNEIKFSTDELISLAKNHPELLSNNVVTRPLMQELLFPSLAFIGGPGEIGYWAALKPVFSAFQIKMPPVLPRLSFTFLSRNTEKVLKKYDITAEYAINNGVSEIKYDWLEAKNNPPIHEITEQIKQTIEEAHRPLREIANGMRSDLGAVAQKNLYYLHSEVEYLEDRILKVMKEKYDKELYEFDLLDLALRPSGGLQERVWNPLPWLNKYGPAFIKQLTRESCSFENGHYAVYM